MQRWTMYTSNSYGLFERVFRTTVFQIGVIQSGWMEKVFIYGYKAIATCRPCPSVFNQARDKEALHWMKGLGAEERFLTTSDGRSKIHVVRARASALEKKINSFGGTWVTDKGDLVIVPPKKGEKDWANFEQQVLLSGTGWQKRHRDGAIITSSGADLIYPKAFCFFHFHSPGMSMFQDRERLGFYLGMKQDVCFFDHGGTGSSIGIPSEGRYYLEAEAVWDLLKREYSPHQIFLTGTCGGAAVAAYMKKKLHSSGVHFIGEQSFVDLKKSMVDPQGIIPAAFAAWTWGALKGRDLIERPLEDGFSTESKWSTLPFSRYGKVILIHSQEDQTLQRGEAERYFALAKRVNESVVKIPFSIPNTNPHNELCLKDRAIHSPLVKAIFS